MTGIAWAGLMRVGMISLGLKPDEFWQLTPAEFLVLRGQAADMPGMLNRDVLAALSAEFPDTRERGDHHGKL